MATREALASDIGSITRSAGGGVSSSGGPCPPGVIGGMSILRFGKSLPLVELFETFMITGFVLVCVAGSSYYTFVSIVDILKSEGATPGIISIANAAAHAQPVWIGVGLIIFILGIVLYYFHRRVISNPS